MKEEIRRKLTIEEKAAILAQYDHAATGAQRQSVLREHGIAEAHIVRFRKQLSRTVATSHVILTDAPKAKVVLKPKEVIEVSAEPGIDYLVNQATDHVTEARRLIDKARFMNGNFGVVSARFQSSLVSADEGLTLVLLDLAMASLCNDFW